MKDQEKLLEEIKNIKDDPTLPKIPMKPNTHSKKTKGFVHGNETKINISPTISMDEQAELMLGYIQGSWNSLTDEERDLVKTLKITKSKAVRAMTWTGGSWDSDKRVLQLRLNPRAGFNKTISNIFHEIGHAKWWKLKQGNPEKVEKFRRRFKELGARAPTSYAESYRSVKLKTERKQTEFRNFRKRMNLPIRDWEEERLERNKKIVEDLYENETHSELNSYAMGWLPKEKLIVDGETLKKYMEMYKELHDLE